MCKGLNMSKFVSIKDRVYNAKKITKVELDEGDEQIGITYDTCDCSELDLIQFSDCEIDVMVAWKQLEMDLLRHQ